MNKNKVPKNNSDKINIFYMIKKICPLCFSVQPSYYIFIQSINVLNGLTNGADLMITQIFFDSIYNVSVGKDSIISAIIAFILFIAFKLGANIFEGMRQFTVDTFSYKADSYLNSEINKKSALIDPIEYENPKTLDNINKASKGVMSAIYFNTIVSFILTYHLPYFIFMIFYLSSLKPMLTLSLLFVFIPVLISHLLRSISFAELEDKSASQRRELEAYYTAACGKDFYKETRMLGSFTLFKNLITGTITSLNSAIFSTKKKTALIDVICNTLSLLGYGGILFLSVKYLLSGEISIGAFAAVYSSIDMLFSAMDYFIGFHLASIANDFGLISNFLKFIKITPDKRANLKVNKKDNIILENVSFKYPNTNDYSLKNLNLLIKAGETIAIVGENGAGKTTLVKLISGMYKPTNGNVKIGETDISTISYRSLFENISGVFQKYQRYSLSLKENVQISDFDYNDENDSKTKQKLDENNVDKDNKSIYPDGINTILSREFDGVDLSGGQWQRIAIARGFYRKSDIIVLDEPTAAIDPIEESNIYMKFAQIAKGKTAIIVTHRMGAAKIADRIIVLKDGEIVEMGNHNELLDNNSVYAEMFNTQAKWYN